jgi:autophagy-related protein 16
MTCHTAPALLGWLQGIMGAVNDVAFTSDGRKLLGAGGDKRLLLWHVHSGQVAHTLTGHTNVVTCCACSVTQEAVAVSAGDDRCLKLWDLAKGYCSRSIPCSKMPNALALSLDGSTIFTGGRWNSQQQG